jgi:serine/threonine protein kinase
VSGSKQLISSNNEKNILVLHLGPRWWVKIADFGIAKRDACSALRTTAGTEAYVAPEVLGFHRHADANAEATAPYSSSQQDRKAYSVLVDIWSLGVIVYQMVVAKRPFDNMGQLSEYVSSSRALLIGNGSVPEICADFICKTMEINPAARPTAGEALRHGWFDGHQGGSAIQEGGASSARYVALNS